MRVKDELTTSLPRTGTWVAVCSSAKSLHAGRLRELDIAQLGRWGARVGFRLGRFWLLIGPGWEFVIEDGLDEHGAEGRKVSSFDSCMLLEDLEYLFLASLRGQQVPKLVLALLAVHGVLTIENSWAVVPQITIDALDRQVSVQPPRRECLVP